MEARRGFGCPLFIPTWMSLFADDASRYRTDTRGERGIIRDATGQFCISRWSERIGERGRAIEGNPPTIRTAKRTRVARTHSPSAGGEKQIGRASCRERV